MTLVDPAVVGTAHAPRTVVVERGRLRLFALAIGETDPVYTDLGHARAAGHPDLPVPPTYFFGLNLGGDVRTDMRWLTDLGIDLTRMLHGGQEFHYHDLAHAGDELVLSPHISGVRTTSGGRLQLVSRTTEVRRPDSRPVLTMTETIAVPRPEVREGTG